MSTSTDLREIHDRTHRSLKGLLAHCGASDDELNTRRAMTTWGDKVKTLTPAHVILRTQTHAYQHQGQVAALCRLMGKPVPRGLDYPHS